MLGNVPDFVVLTLALSKIDCTVVPIDPTTGNRELELILAAAPLRALVTRPRGSEGSISANGTTTQPGRKNKVTEEEEVTEIRRRLPGTLLTCSIFKRDFAEFPVNPVVVLFTSDSLGDPKGVFRTKENLDAITDNVVGAINIDKTSRILTAVPLFHSYGWDCGLMPALRTSATMYLEEEVSERRLYKVLRDHKIDVVPGTPNMYGNLLKLPTGQPLRVEKPRFLSGGSKLDLAIAESFFEKYNVTLMHCYHSTETGLVSLDDDAKNPKSVGKAIGNIEIKVTASGKNTTSKEGKVWVRSNTLSPHSIGPYQDVPTAASSKKKIEIGEADKDGWFRTGDLGKLDRSGRLFLTSREDSVVKIEGKRVALGEIQGCLEAFHKVKKAKANIETDPQSGSVVVASVVTSSSCLPEEIIDHCARNLAPYKVPRRIKFCDAI